jgi:hypothetical protein
MYLQRASKMHGSFQGTMRTLMKDEFGPCRQGFRYVSKQTEVLCNNCEIKDLLASLIRGKAESDRDRLHRDVYLVFSSKY